MNYQLQIRGNMYTQNDTFTEGQWESYIDPSQGELTYESLHSCEERLMMEMNKERESVQWRTAPVDSPVTINSLHRRIQPMHPKTRKELVQYLADWARSHDFYSVFGNELGQTVKHMVDFQIQRSTEVPGIKCEATTWSHVLTLMLDECDIQRQRVNKEGESADWYSDARIRATRYSLLVAALLEREVYPIPDAGMFRR